MSFRSRGHLSQIVAISGLLLLAIGGIALGAGARHRHVFRGQRSVLSASEIRRLSTGATKHSIIILKNQLLNLPARKGTARARASAATAAQAGVRSELARVHATNVRSFQIINAISATISTA